MRVLAGDPERTDLQPEDMSWTVRCDDEFAITAVRLPAAQPSWAFVVQEADRCAVRETALVRGRSWPCSMRIDGCSRVSRLHSLHTCFMQPPLFWLSAAQPVWPLAYEPADAPCTLSGNSSHEQGTAFQGAQCQQEVTSAWLRSLRRLSSRFIDYAVCSLDLASRIQPSKPGQPGLTRWPAGSGWGGWI